MTHLDTSTPIVVPSNPAQVQVGAAIRQVAASAGIIFAAFGASALAAKANIIVTVAPEIAAIMVVVGPALWGAATWIGQQVTRRHAQDAAAMAAQLPDEIAKVK